MAPSSHYSALHLRSCVHLPRCLNPLLFALSKSFLLILVVSTLCYSSAESSETRIEWSASSRIKRIFTTDDGLPQNTPTDILQTRDGYLWIATYGGLARFDGANFRVFTTSDTPNLVSNRILALAEDTGGRLWIGSEDGSVVAYEDSHFSVIHKSRGQPLDSVIRDLAFDVYGHLWIASDMGLRIYNPQTNEYREIPNDTVLPRTAPANLSVREFATDSTGDLYMATNAGLIRNSSGAFQLFDQPPIKEFGLSQLLSNSFGSPAVRSGSTLSVYDGNSMVPASMTESAILPEHGVHTLITENKLYWFSPRGLLFFPLPVDLDDSELRSSYVDNEGSLWIGTQASLIQIRPSTLANFTIANSQGGAGAGRSVIGTGDGSIWFSTENSIIRFEGYRKRHKTYTFNETVISLTVEPKTGFVWAGTQHGVFRFNGEVFIQENRIDLDGSSDLSIAFDVTGKLWIGTKDRGLRTFADRKTVAYTKEDGLVDNNIVRFLFTSTGAVWIGSVNGLSLLENGIFRNFTTDQGLESNSIRDIYQDSETNIWVGTYGGGINLYRDGKFVSVTRKNGLCENVVSRIIPDDRGAFWMLGNQGIFAVQRDDLLAVIHQEKQRVYCRSYGKPEGLPVSEGNGISAPAGWRSMQGEFWFPLIQGAAIMTPSLEIVEPSPTYIEEITSSGVSIDFDSKATILRGDENLEIKYSGIALAYPEHLQFRYRLEGVDKDWHEAGTRRTAYYSYVPPGDYTFVVESLYGSASSTPTSAKIRLTIVGPFWRTNAFYLMLVVSSIGIVILIFQLRLRRLESQRQQQVGFAEQLINAHESERKRIASEIHDGLGHTLLLIRQRLAQIPSGIGIDQKHLAEADELSTQALTEIRAISSALGPMHLRRFGLTSTIQDMFHSVEEASGISIRDEVTNIDSYFDLDQQASIYRILQESLNNVLKHSGATRVDVKISVVGNSLRLSIKDNGVGFDGRLNVFRQSTGGLYGIRNRVILLMGTCRIKSKPNNGTTIQIDLPIPRSTNE